MSSSLSGKNILITGGTSELGKNFVVKAARAGAKVFFSYFSDEAAARELTDAGAEAIKLDLRDMRAIDAAAKQMKAMADQLHCVIHNAAAVRDHTIQNLSEEDWDEVMTVDLKAPYYLTKKVLSLLFKKGSSACHPERSEGSALEQKQILRRDIQEAPQNDKSERNAPKKIFFITSRAAVTGGFGISNYAAAKAGLIGLTKSLAQELGKKEILVNAVNPGFMKSKMTRDLPENVLEANLQASPIARYSDPAEVADFLIYLCSDQMTQATGQVFHFESRKI